MQRRIVGTTMPVLEFLLEANDAVISEAGELSWMSRSISMTTHTQMRRCCMDRAKGEFSLFPVDLRSDVLMANGVRTSRIQHAVEDGHADRRFSLLTRDAARSKARTDYGLVSAHRGFNQSASAVADLLLPAQPPAPTDYRFRGQRI